MHDCIFCKIIRGEIPASKVYENDKFFAFLDINPVNKGHMLLIPKEHVVWMVDASDNLIGEIFVQAKVFMQKLIKNIPCDYAQLSVVGEEVPHFHIHIIPRYFNKSVSATFEHVKYDSNEEIEKYISLINK